MTDIERIMLGGISGVSIYVVGQLLSKLIIEPLYNLKVVLAETQFNLSFHAPTIHTPMGRTAEKSDEAYKALVASSCDLISKVYAVPCYPVFRYLAFCALPKKESIIKASIDLRGLSTHLHEEGSSNLDVVNRRVLSIRRNLRLNSIE